MASAVSTAETPIGARQRLCDRYCSKIQTNRQIDRSLVSFQANRKHPFYRWLKYKEGFSAQFVEHAISQLGCPSGVLLDPFAGVGTALFAGRAMGWNTIGIELLPVGFFAAEARLACEEVRPQRFQREVEEAENLDWETLYAPEMALSHVSITRGAFPEKTERAIAGFRAYCSRLKDVNVRKLFDLACISVLETVSYTRKDGQYLRWDQRARRERVESLFDKGTIPSFQMAIRHKLREMCSDVLSKDSSGSSLFTQEGKHVPLGSMDLRSGSSLRILPTLENASIDCVVTSPPYCNRYDYTRTYALELVYLGATAEDIRVLRQRLLSCTVENKTKADELRELYSRNNALDAFNQVSNVFDHQEGLHEVLGILEDFRAAGKLNNSNIPSMVRNYFFEMAFVIWELARLLRLGGTVIMVNDNVRYAGEEVPVDLILCDFASSFGLKTEHIWTLARGKGNSSQQMGVHGRTELRKCVYVWRKGTKSTRVTRIR
jgi:DNA modification methylase